MRFTSMPIAASALLLTSARRHGTVAAFRSYHGGTNNIRCLLNGNTKAREHIQSCGPQPQEKMSFSTSSKFSTSVSEDTVERTLPQAQESASYGQEAQFKMNLHTISVEELASTLSTWGHKPYRAKQIIQWIRNNGATSFSEMKNLPSSLITQLSEHATIGNLQLDTEQISKDGTKKRAYRLSDGQLIESVLMPYEDGRNTACISSQAGCAMGCVFCATGQMGFARQLTSDEIFEQVARFDSELKLLEDKSGKKERISNVVMMGMGEPLANYRNVMGAITRMNEELGIGARKITVSTVGVVPSIRKLMEDGMQVRLAVSLHCSNDEERSRLLPANKRYGGLSELLNTVREYTETTKRRVTFEWALIEHENDTPEVARELGRVLRQHGIRRDYMHINLIPLNPTGGYQNAKPSGRGRVNQFIKVLEEDFGISATPRVRRGIDIDAGCGQLKAKVNKKEKSKQKQELQTFMQNEPPATTTVTPPPMVGVYEDDEEDEYEYQVLAQDTHLDDSEPNQIQEFALDEEAYHLDFDDDEFEDVVYDSPEQLAEIDRLMSIVQASNQPPPPSTTQTSPESDTIDIKVKTTKITDETSIKEAKKRRKKLLKHLKSINRLREMAEEEGRKLRKDELIKIGKEVEFRAELESVEHNLQ